MKVVTTPAEVTSVEDVIFGNLSLVQLILIILPIFLGLALFFILPPAGSSSLYKLIVLGPIGAVCWTSSIRFKKQLLLELVILRLRYRCRIKLFLYDKAAER